MQLQFSDIPLWLQDSEFYRNLSDDDPEESIDIPSDCFQETNCIVETTEELAHILKVLSFWGTYEIPQSVLELCYTNEPSVWNVVFVETIGEGMPEHKAVVMAFKDPSQLTLSVALSTSRPEFITFWLEKNEINCEQNRHAIAQACRFGRLDLVQTLRQRNFIWNDQSFCAAAQYGHIQILQYLHENDCPSNRVALKYAARGGHVECMKYVRSIKNYWFESITLEFAVSQHYATIRPSETDYWTDDFTIAPPAGGYLECLRYALENRCPIHKRATERAAQYGLLNCLQLLHAHNAWWDEYASKAAAAAGHLDCLVYLIENHCPCDFLATEQAAAHGHMTCLQYLIEHIPRVWECGTTTAAARGGHIQCLQLLKQYRYGWNDQATAAAARGGYLECLQFLHVNGCVWNADAVKYAALGGHMECLVYLYKNGCVWNSDAPASAALHGHFACLQYLHNNNCPWNEATATRAAQNGHIECLLYAVENGCPCSSVDTLKAAAGASTVDCLKYLIEERGVTVAMDGVVFGEALIKARTANMTYLIDKGCHVKSFAYL